MSHVEIGLIGLAILAVLLIIGMDVGFTMLLSGIIGFALIGGWKAGFANAAIIAFDRMNDYTFSALPLFLLMGAFVSGSGLGAEAYTMARIWLGRLKGGLAIASIGGAALFGAMSGSSLAGSLVMGKVAYPEMRKAGYKRPLAAGVISVGGTLDLLIPPSMAFVLIGIMAELSIGQLLMAGVIPGILVTLFYMATVSIWCKIDPQVAPTVIAPSTWKQKAGSLKLSWPVLLLFGLVMGGLYGGIFTAVEAAAVGALGAVIISLVKRQLTGRVFWDCLKDTAKMTAMILILVVGAFVFNGFLAVTQIPTVFSEFLLGLPIGRWGVVVAIVIFYIIAGTFFDPYSILILTIPIFYPAMRALGFDLIWWSVIMVRLIEIGNISPPAGINLFGLKGVIDAPMSDIFKGVYPFLISDFFNIILLCVFPVLSTFLPYHMI
jgi:C4-dicarboxylate transporter DctM subunit